MFGKSTSNSWLSFTLTCLLVKSNFQGRIPYVPVFAGLTGLTKTHLHKGWQMGLFQISEHRLEVIHVPESFLIWKAHWKSQSFFFNFDNFNTYIYMTYIYMYPVWLIVVLCLMFDFDVWFDLWYKIIPPGHAPQPSRRGAEHMAARATDCFRARVDHAQVDGLCSAFCFKELTIKSLKCNIYIYYY